MPQYVNQSANSFSTNLDGINNALEQGIVARVTNLQTRISSFVDRLQKVNEQLYGPMPQDLNRGAESPLPPNNMLYQLGNLEAFSSRIEKEIVRLESGM